MYYSKTMGAVDAHLRIQNLFFNDQFILGQSQKVIFFFCFLRGYFLEILRDFLKI